MKIVLKSEWYDWLLMHVPLPSTAYGALQEARKVDGTNTDAAYLIECSATDGQLLYQVAYDRLPELATVIQQAIHAALG
ncbi:MAG TPA: hypothetical protein VFU31_05805 [Candidatus Binatia bacterium]|nr:hypothetical protein [Candidatus Binatia bacterium]